MEKLLVEILQKSSNQAHQKDPLDKDLLKYAKLNQSNVEIAQCPCKPNVSMTVPDYVKHVKAMHRGHCLKNATHDKNGNPKDTKGKN